MATETTTRAYTLKLSGNTGWRNLIWGTHVAVNRGAFAWGDWLLTLRGGLPASLAEGHPERRVLLALSWLSVESPASLVPTSFIVDREDVIQTFSKILSRLQIQDSQAWIDACGPALTARIRDDAVWVNRSAAFAELVGQFPGLTSDWASQVIFNFLEGEESYFKLPEIDSAKPAPPDPFVVKAGHWLTEVWGSGPEADSRRNARALAEIADCLDACKSSATGVEAIKIICERLQIQLDKESTIDDHLKAIAKSVGWKGNPSSERRAIESLCNVTIVNHDRLAEIAEKCKLAATEKNARLASSGDREARRHSSPWLEPLKKHFADRIGLPFRQSRDHQNEYAVMLDHALRRVSSAHTWIKRAEVERRRFREDAEKLAIVPQNACDWLDMLCEARSSESGAAGEYLIRKRAIDGWDKILQAWQSLGSEANRRQRIDAAREVQRNLDENEKFGDIQLFAGFGDEDGDEPQMCLADDDAACVWQRADGKFDPDILKNYVAAKVAERDQQRFKVPAYRHPDPLRHPIYVDYGNSRWGIAYSALEESRNRQKLSEKLATAKTEIARAKVQQQLDSAPNLRNVTLDIWDGAAIQPLELRWHGKRLWKDINLEHFGNSTNVASVTRADRLSRIAAGQSSQAPVSVAGVFQQNDWNGRLQVPRDQLDRLADLVYGKLNGKRIEPDYAKLDRALSDARAIKQWQRLNWFLTTSAKLQPQGPWLDYVIAGLPDGIEYKKGRTGYYLNYAANEGRKGRARLQIARLRGLRVLSLDLGHRYAAACAVWETLTNNQMIEICRLAKRPEPATSDLYIHIEHETTKLQKSGRNKGKPVTETTIYRRTSPDMWARLERQFLIKLQGEDRPARRAHQAEIDRANEFRRFVGMNDLAERLRIDDLQKDLVWLARLGLRRLGDIARVAFAMTTTQKPISGGRMVELSREQRITYLQDALVLWQELANSRNCNDEWASQAWQFWVIDKLEGPKPVLIDEEISRSERKKKIESSRGLLLLVAEKLADPQCEYARELNRLWSAEWEKRKTMWQTWLCWLRRFILPRKNDVQNNPKALRHVGGLSARRLQTIRGLYQVLKSFQVRAEPEDLNRNIPKLGDESLAKFGHRILGQLERLREQRIKQLASRIVEAALGAGRMKQPKGRDVQRPQQQIDLPCHVVVIEDLEHYRPEDSRLRRENRQLMDWAARNVRKYVVEGCQLHGLHFVEVSPAYTSRQDSRTGAPGIRCEDVSRATLEAAARRISSSGALPGKLSSSHTDSRAEREVRFWARELSHAQQSCQAGDAKPRDRILVAVASRLVALPQGLALIRLPRRGGELFVSASVDSPLANGIQADLNAAANIGLKALTDPDWEGAWWYLLVNRITGQPNTEKVQGCPLWLSGQAVLEPAAQDVSPVESKSKKRSQTAKREKTDVYAWNPLFAIDDAEQSWQGTQPYWNKVEQRVANRLQRDQTEPENPF